MQVSAGADSLSQPADEVQALTEELTQLQQKLEAAVDSEYERADQIHALGTVQSVPVTESLACWRLF